jgi:hypothetical protein
LFVLHLFLLGSQLVPTTGLCDVLGNASAAACPAGDRLSIW